jgi:hypothetical protein
MKARVFLALIFCTAIVVAAAGQSTPADTKDKNFPTTLQPVNPVKYYGPKKSRKKKKSTVTYDAQSEYYDRIENSWREREKREKTYKSGQATDYMKPPYFGHKKPPKVRPIEKRKYCKICGIRH